jgi:hypothetical protein
MASSVSRLRRALRWWLPVLSLFLGLMASAQAAPAAPSGVRGAVTTSTAMTLIWDDNSTDETHWEIVYTGGGGGTLPLASGTTATTGTISLDLSPLSNNTTYTFKIRAYIGTTANASPTATRSPSRRRVLTSLAASPRPCSRMAPFS